MVPTKSAQDDYFYFAFHSILNIKLPELDPFDDRLGEGSTDEQLLLKSSVLQDRGGIDMPPSLPPDPEEEGNGPPDEV